MPFPIPRLAPNAAVPAVLPAAPACKQDVYIAMELADGGDLFHLRGQMSSAPGRVVVARTGGPTGPSPLGMLTALAGTLDSAANLHAGAAACPATQQP